MFLEVGQSTANGRVAIPGSKSHTIRGLILALLADGESRIRHPLDSLDTRAAVEACRAFGAEVDTRDPAVWVVKGCAGRPHVPGSVVDVGNSGTTLYVVMATAALCSEGWTVLTGDEQIRRRPAGALVEALRSLGAEVFSTRDNGMCPLVVRGPLRGGSATIEAVTSQWVTAILLNAPFAAGETHLTVTRPNEIPYIQITLDWLQRLGVEVRHDGSFASFRIPGGQRLAGFDRAIPADFSSATFFLVAGAALGGAVELTGLDMRDSQGDKAVIDYLRAMGADIAVEDSLIAIKSGALHGADLDLNATPDALPAMAVAAALARGTTRLGNVAQARVKETDRIAVMAAELRKMGVQLEELPDGLVIEGKGAPLHVSGSLNGHGDHRVVMALSLAAMAAAGTSRISTAEAAAVTFPEFVELMQGLGARMNLVDG